MRRDVPTRVETHSTGTADGRLYIGVGKAHAHGRDFVKVWRVQVWVSGAAEIVKAQLIIHDEQDVHRHSPPTLKMGHYRMIFAGPPAIRMTCRVLVQKRACLTRIYRK